MKNNELKELILVFWETLAQSLEALKKSVERCENIDFSNSDLSDEDSDALDALTSKFARSSDIYTQKLLNSILRFKRENAVTFVDKMNIAEKAKIVKSAEKMIEIRDLRNEISHEYWMDQLRDQQAYTLEITPMLFENIAYTKNFLEKEKIL